MYLFLYTEISISPDNALISSVFTYGGFPRITLNFSPLLILFQLNGAIFINFSTGNSIFTMSISDISEFPAKIFSSKFGKIGSAPLTDGSVSSSNSLSNKENLLTSTA